MGHTAVSTIKVSSVTLQIWQHGAKQNYIISIFFDITNQIDHCPVITSELVQSSHRHGPSLCSMKHDTSQVECPGLPKYSKVAQSGAKRRKVAQMRVCLNTVK